MHTVKNLIIEDSGYIFNAKLGGGNVLFIDSRTLNIARRHSIMKTKDDLLSEMVSKPKTNLPLVT